MPVGMPHGSWQNFGDNKTIQDGWILEHIHESDRQSHRITPRAGPSAARPPKCQDESPSVPSWRDYYSNNNQYKNHAGIRCWGHIMWDAAQLEDTGAKELLLQQQEKAWGDEQPGISNMIPSAPRIEYQHSVGSRFDTPQEKQNGRYIHINSGD